MKGDLDGQTAGASSLTSAQRIKEIMIHDRWNTRNARAYHRYRMISSRRNWQKLITGQLSSVPAGAPLFEVGAGTGFITGMLAGAGYPVVAADLSLSMLNLADRNLTAAGVRDRAGLIQGDAESLPAGDNTCAAVVSRWVLWNLPRPAKALAEMARILSPGGQLVLVDGQHQEMTAFSRWRSALVDLVLAGRLPGSRASAAFTSAAHALPRLDAPKAAAVLKDLGLGQVRYRQVSDREADGVIKNWLMGNVWKSYLVTGVKPG